MTAYPAYLNEAIKLGGPYRAGGTDLMSLRRLGLPPGEHVDLGKLPELRGITVTEAGLRIGALVTLRELANHSAVQASYPALAAAARAIANPNVRSLATVGGNVLQHTRCDYFRHPDVDCLRKTGSGCPAREGEHANAVCFDTAACVAVHPSTLASVLLCHDATVEVAGKGRLPIEVAIAHRGLTEGEVLTAFHLPAPWPDERAHYQRVSARAAADWPIAEVVMRTAGPTVRIVAGAVAPTPMRLLTVEQWLSGRKTAEVEDVTALLERAATPLPGTRYKVKILSAAVVAAFDDCRALL